MYIIVVANGQFPSSSALLNRFSSADSIVCCDGAFEIYFCWCRQHSFYSKEVIVVGDGDSLPSDILDEARTQGQEVCRVVVSEQESNDLSKAVHFALQQIEGMDDVKVDILGATGLREDHALGNISLLAYYAQEFPQVEFRMLSDYGYFQPVNGIRQFDSFPGQQVSIFSFSPEVPVSVSGLRYPIENRHLNWLWEGTLNESIGTTFKVSGGTMVVYQQGIPIN